MGFCGCAKRQLRSIPRKVQAAFEVLPEEQEAAAIKLIKHID